MSKYIPYSAINQRAYDRMAHLYQKDRNSMSSDAYVRSFLKLLKSQSSILDLGCGSGLPVALQCIKAGHLVTGIDISKAQISAARRNCPTGQFLVGDIAELTPNEWSVDGVIAMYSMFHIPKHLHANILKTLASFLPSGGPLLISMGDKEFEGQHTLHGESVWSSHYAPSHNTTLLRHAGFDILLNEMSSAGHERHQIILAKKQ